MIACWLDKAMQSLFLLLASDHFVLQVIGFAFENKASQHLEKQHEPVVVQCAHDRQEDATEGKVGLERGKLTLELALCEDKVNHLRQTPDASDEPDHHAN